MLMFGFRSGRRPHILVVDDEPDMCWTLENILRSAGYAVTTTTSGAEAIEKAQGRFFNLALLDIRLPDMEGIELVAPLKEMHPDMVVMIVTAYASLETAVQALNGGASAYITKPFNVDEVLATVREVLEKQRLVIEKRRVEEALRRSKKEWESTFDAMSDWVSLVDLEARILRTNRVGEELVGMPLAEMIGQTCCKLVHGADEPIPGCPLQKMLHTHQRETAELQMPDGNRWLTITVDPVMDEEGNLFRAVHVVRDITERKRAEEALQRSERQLAIRNRISDIFLTTPDEEMYGEALQVVLEIMESKYGIFGYIDEDGALVCPSMAKGVWEQCQIPDKDIVFPRETWGGIWGYALAEKKTLYSNQSFPVPEGHIPIHRALDVPIVHRGQVIGNLLVGNKATDYSKEDCELLEAIANHIAPILHARLQRDREERGRQRAEKEIRRHLERIEALREIDRAIASTLNLPEVLDIILEELERVIPYDTAGIFLFSDGVARLTAGRGFPDMERALQVAFPVKEDALTRELLQEKHPLVLADAQADERFLSRGGTEYARSWIGVPLIAKGGTVGLLTIDHREPGVYDKGRVEMAQAFASQVAIAIENARLYQEAQQELAQREQAEEGLRQSLERLQRALEGTVNVLVSTIEMKDPYTAGHQRRVTQLACAVAQEMGLPEERIEGLRVAGLIHDLGKINVPAEILSKPGALSDLEYGLIRAHPQIGYDILKTTDFPWPVAEIVLQHHERLDGSGYPQGLAGEEIRLEARILAVADVVEAMASFRPYRPAHGIDKALEEISQNRGVLYDPEVVDVCLRLFTEKGFKFE